MARSTAELERESQAKGNMCGCGEDDKEREPIQQHLPDEYLDQAQLAFDFSEARELLKKCMVFAGWVADKTLAEKMTKNLRESASRLAEEVEGYLDETSTYDDDATDYIDVEVVNTEEGAGS